MITIILRRLRLPVAATEHSGSRTGRHTHTANENRAFSWPFSRNSREMKSGKPVCRDRIGERKSKKISHTRRTTTRARHYLDIRGGAKKIAEAQAATRVYSMYVARRRCRVYAYAPTAIDIRLRTTETVLSRYLGTAV